MSGRRLVLASCALFAAASCLAEDSAGLKLRRDPFAMPAAFRLDVAGNAALGRPVEPPAPPWSPHIRGIMAAGERSIVDLEGVMLGIGDRIEGYRLIKVEEREAVFQKDGRRVVLRLPTEKEQKK